MIKVNVCGSGGQNTLNVNKSLYEVCHDHHQCFKCYAYLIPAGIQRLLDYSCASRHLVDCSGLATNPNIASDADSAEWITDKNERQNQAHDLLLQFFQPT